MNSPRLFFGALVGIPIVAGAIVRLFGLGEQIVLDDEVHALRVALGRTLDQILSQYPIVDVSVPLSALDRLALDLGLPLSETVLRLPSLLAGLLALTVIPWLMRDRLSRPAMLLFGLLLALSPWLVYYSRFARPYMPATLTVFLALVLFRRFHAEGNRLDGLGYAAFGALSIWLFFLSAPAVLAPVLWGVLPDRDASDEVMRAARRRTLAAVAVLALFTLLLLAPLLDDILRAFAFHVGPHPSADPGDGSGGNPLGIVMSGLAILSGSTRWIGVGLFWLVVARGVLVHRSNDRATFRLFLFVVLFQFAVMSLTASLRVSHLFPLAFARYLVPLLPILYYWAAQGLLEPWFVARGGRGKWWGWAVAALLIASWMGSGPYSSIAAAGFHASFAGSKQSFNSQPGPTGNVRGETVYDSLAESPEDTVILECPGDEHDSILRLYAENQRIHERRVIVTEFPMVDGSRLAFRNMVRPGPTAILDSPAGRIVIHLDLFSEVRDRFGSIPRHLEPRAANHASVARQLARDLQAAWGPPDHVDGWIVSWNLDRIRVGG